MISICLLWTSTRQRIIAWKLKSDYLAEVLGGGLMYYTSKYFKGNVNFTEHGEIYMRFELFGIDRGFVYLCTIPKDLSYSKWTVEKF